MARHIKSEVGLKSKSQKKVSVGARLFGFIKNVNVKLTKPNSALLVTTENYMVKAEMERAKAAYCKQRGTVIN